MAKITDGIHTQNNHQSSFQKDAKPYLSIVIPTLNEEGFIGDLLHEILKQEMSYEIIVSDSGSTDCTKDIVLSFAAQHPSKKIRFIPAPIRGVSVARNNGAAFATADYIIFLDADTRIPSDFIRNAYLEIKRRQLDGAGCHMEPNSRKLFDRAIFSFTHHCINNALQYTKKPGSAGAGIIVKRSIHNAIGGFNINLPTCEDLDYIHKISEAGKFRMLKSTNIIFNVRRFEEEGRARLLFKYAIWASCYMLNIKRANLDYEYGKFKTKKEEDAGIMR